MKLRRRILAGVGVAAPLALVLAGCNTRFGASLDRPADPVVLEGSSLPKLLGTDPSHVVGFSWDGSAWHQVPVQVDERDYVSPGVIYHLPVGSYPKLYGTSTVYKMLVYTPPPVASAGYTSVPTYTPSDSDPTFDSNDELSFLASDSGQHADAGAGNPSGVDISTRQQVQASDPLAPANVGYVYLFHSATLTGGSAGTTGVDYTFSLDSGSYLSTYKMGTSSLAPNKTWGFNPEHSSVTTPAYRQTMSDRWLNDGLSITAGGATGVDILDRAHYYVTNAGCVRTEDTFDGADTGEGAFIVNISGPVRAIRSYIGANSYDNTVNTDIFYPAREDTVTELRGHAGLPGFASADDLTTGTTGMTYSDPANTNLPIDGVPDPFTPITATTGTGSTPVAWQLIAGPQGSMVTTRMLSTDISGLQLSTIYQDQSPASPAPCTGDPSAWGQNGESTNSPVYSVPITDPTLTATPNSFVATRVRYFEGPDLLQSTAATLDSEARNPVTVSVS